MRRKYLILGILVLTLLLQSCDSTQNDWQTAKKANTIESYSGFLGKHPQSDFNKEAQIKIDSLKFLILINKEWSESFDSHSIKKMELFLDKFPQSIYTSKALNLIDSISFKTAIIESKINNSTVDTIHLKNLKYSFNNLNEKDKQDLICVLIERFNYIKGTSCFIAPVKLAEGNDLSKILRPSGLESSGNISQESKGGKKVVVTFQGVLCGQYLDECLMIGRGDYFAKNNAAKINFKGSYTIKKDDEFVLFSTYYPKDALYFRSGMNGAEFQLPFGKNTVIRVNGEVDNFFDGISIKSDQSFPMHLILRTDGLYYLMGKGEVSVNKSKTIVF